MIAAGLADWAGGLRLAGVPAAVRAAACRQLLDGLAVAVAAAREGAAAPAVAVAAGLGGPPEAAIIGTRDRVSAPAAALANGTLVHALDFDDTHPEALVHPTAVVLPAAFAVGQQVAATGADVLRAALVGYEVACRLGAATPHGFHARGLHATHACGVIAAAAVAATLQGLPPERTVDALGVAGSAAGGLLEFLDTGASTKQLHPGTAGLNGILAARLAAAGATGPATVIEGRRGLLAALSARPADLASITAGLGTRWEVTRAGRKSYPACQLFHATLDAVRAAVPVGGLAPAQVAAVAVDVHPDSVPVVCEPRAGKLRPASPYAAKFSLPWSVAALLVDGRVGPATYRSGAIGRPVVAELAERVTVRAVDSGTAAAAAPGRVTLHLTGGAVREGRAVPAGAGPEKFAAICGGSPAAGELAGRVAALADESSVDRILELTAELVV